MNTVEKMSKLWNKLKYWQKGGIIGLLIGTLPILNSLPLIKSLLTIFSKPFNLDFSYNLLLFLLIGLVLGALNGFILEKVKKRYKSLQEISNAKKCFVYSFFILVILLIIIMLFILLWLLIGAFFSPHPLNDFLGGLFLAGIFILASVLFFPPLIIILSLFFSMLGWILDLLKRHKILNLWAWIIYLLFWYLFLFLAYAALSLLLIRIILGIIGG